MNSEDTQILAKIAINCVEICSAVGTNALLGAIVIAINRYHSNGKTLFAVGVVSLATGLSLPPLMEQCAKTNELAAAAIGLATASVLLIGQVWCFFLPMKIAKFRNHAHVKAIIVLNLLFFVPLSWLLALWWATRPEKELIANPAEYYSPAVLAICEQADRIAKLLADAGFAKASEKICVSSRQDVAGDALLLRLDQSLSRLLFDFELPDAMADDVRSLSEEVATAQRI